MLAHDFQDATYVRQSLDYAQFGRVTATLGANGLADATGVVTAFAHHGSLLDAATGLQLKGERWYSPDLGRFVSEDPIQDGANWYMFAGNDPVNSADPSGLSQQGHPLAGGYSGNVTRQPTIRPGNIPANALSTVGAPLGHAISRGQGTRSAPAATTRPFSYTLGSDVGSYSSGIDVAPFLAGPQLSHEARLGAAKQLAGRWGAVDDHLSYVRRSIDELPARIAFFENQGHTGNLRSTAGNLASAKRELARAQALLPKLEVASYALASEYSDRGFDSVRYSTFSPSEQPVDVVGIRNVAYSVAHGGPVSGLGYAPSPVDFVIGGMAVGLNSGFRAGVSALAQDLATEATGLPILPSPRKTFSQAQEFYSNATGNSYQTFQRTDIDWNQVRTSGDRRAVGMANSEAAENLGLSPQLGDGNFATLHHSRQNARGPLFEASTRYHNISNINKAPLHPYGTSGHPHNPMGSGSGSPRDLFQNQEVKEYWMWRAISR